MIRSKIHFNFQIERKKLMNKGRKVINLETLREAKQEFQLQLSNRFQMLTTNDDVEISYQDLTKVALDTAQGIAGSNCKKGKIDKISDETRAMLNKHREVKPNNGKYGKVQYVELCKTIRKRMRQEIRQYNINTVERALKENKSVNTSRKTNCRA